MKPAKPRTFIRPIMGPHRNDAFRSRIPNSSRAPSLHVDDFIALEKHNQQQAATAAYNRIAGKHSVPDAPDVRSRGHSFLQDRGNHFHSAFRPSRGKELHSLKFQLKFSQDSFRVADTSGEVKFGRWGHKYLTSSRKIRNYVDNSPFTRTQKIGNFQIESMWRHENFNPPEAIPLSDRPGHFFYQVFNPVH